MLDTSNFETEIWTFVSNGKYDKRGHDSSSMQYIDKEYQLLGTNGGFKTNYLDFLVLEYIGRVWGGLFRRPFQKICQKDDFFGSYMKWWYLNPQT